VRWDVAVFVAKLIDGADDVIDVAEHLGADAPRS
jgi:hypothetical protein